MPHYARGACAQALLLIEMDGTTYHRLGSWWIPRGLIALPDWNQKTHFQQVLNQLSRSPTELSNKKERRLELERELFPGGIKDQENNNSTLDNAGFAAPPVAMAPRSRGSGARSTLLTRHSCTCDWIIAPTPPSSHHTNPNRLWAWDAWWDYCKTSVKGKTR
jgi:hypothetical protein